MADYIADLHIHSKYSRATSKDMDISRLTEWARIKGISLIATGDFTHPLWFSELKEQLEPKGDGLFSRGGIDFILSAEVCNIYLKSGRTRRIHNIIYAPDIKTVKEINLYLNRYGDLGSDGRPILSVPSAKMARDIFKINPDCMIVPAHVWTPYFALFGSKSGFDSAEECFEEQTENIYALETGLSSDPAMNWRLSGLDRFTLVSNSDAHSPSKLGREANVFSGPVTYKELRDILRTKDSTRFLYTIEFFPQEGKYHWDGHRGCGQRLSPGESKNLNNLCPVCGKRLTIGVANRVERLSDRPEGYKPKAAPPFKSLVPLAEIIAGALDKGAATVRVRREYNKLIKSFGSEFNILLDTPKEDILKHTQPEIGRGIVNAREGRVEVAPGYDGVYGSVKVFTGNKKKEQLTFF
jgi:uncharacterized protein (TIGR00375 family)